MCVFRFLAPFLRWTQANPPAIRMGLPSLTGEKTPPKLKPSARRNNSHAIAGMFMAIFEGELRDSGFVELA
jgi:hypothetical protein